MKELLKMLEEFNVDMIIKHITTNSGISGYLFKFCKGDSKFTISITDYDFINTPEKLLVDYIYEVIKENFNLEETNE